MADYLYYSAGSEDHSSQYSMEDLLSCTVCCEPYHEKHRHPVVLPRCGHSFCRPCIAFMVKKGCIVCPSCRMDQRVEGADSLPTEFSLLAISLAQQVTKQESCANHGVKLSFWCKTCNVSACGECLFEDHPMTAHQVIKSTAYVTEMKESVTNITNKFMDALDGREKRFFEKIFTCTKMINDSVRTVTVLKRDMEEARELMKGVKVVEGISSTQALSEAAKFLGLKWNLQDVNLCFQKVTVKDDTKVEDEDEEEEGEEEDVEAEWSKLTEDMGIIRKEDVQNGSPVAKENVKNGSSVAIEDVSENGITEKEKADQENEKDIDEEENLTEQEKRVRKRIQKVKERLAAASAAAELAALEAQEKNAMKEIENLESQEKNYSVSKTTSTKEKHDKDEDKKAKEPKKIGKLTDEKQDSKSLSRNTRTWQRKPKTYEPVSREPSITPERETAPKSMSKVENLETGTNNKNLEKNEDADCNHIMERVSKEDIRIETNSSLNMNGEISTSTESLKSIGSRGKSEISTSGGSLNITEATPSQENTTENKNESRVDVKKSSVSSTSPVKRPRGRLARNALKRAQTMDLSKKIANEDPDTNKDEESQNIKGLDLETSIASKNNTEVVTDNKDTEVKVMEETKEEPDKSVIEEPKKKKKIVKKEKNPMPVKEKDMFEMEPEEKERIATELLQVPSLTICIEGAGGLLSRIAWESMGLHIYCHQFQELPYDVIIK
ncbi:hypothetical protein SK128_020444, partial [Halocaridina rubra]